MWIPRLQQASLTELLQAALVRLCAQHIDFDGRLEIDGLLCISNGDVSKQIVVKIHDTVDASSTAGKDVPVGGSLLKPRPEQLAGRKRAHREEMQSDSMQRNGERDSLRDPWRHYDRSYHNGRVMDEQPDCSPPSRKVPSAGHVEGAATAQCSDDDTEASKRIVLVDSSPGGCTGKPATQILKLLAIPTRQLSGGPLLPQASVDVKADSSQSTECCPEVDDRMSRPVACKICSATFTSRSVLEFHMRDLHKRFVCKICLNTFTLSCNLRRHMKLHAGVRPHTCRYCDSSFSRSTDLRIHMRKHEEGLLDTSSGSNRCSTCGKLFQTSALLWQHVMMAHGSELKCRICEKTFTTADQLDLHRRTHEQSLLRHSGLKEGSSSSSNDASQYGPDVSLDLSMNNNNSYGGIAWEATKSFLNNNNNNNDDDQILDCSATSCKQRTSVATGNSSHTSISTFDLSAVAQNAKSKKQASVLLDLSCKDAVVQSAETKVNGVLASEVKDVALQMSKTKSKRKGQPVKCSDGLPETLVGESDIVRETQSSRQEHAEALSEDLTGSPAAFVVGSDVPGMDDRSEEGFTKLNGQCVTAEVGEDSPSSVKLDDIGLEEKIFVCRHGGCGSSWLGFHAYENHFANAHYRFPCAQCDQSFTSRNNRRRHAVAHTDAKKHPCETCHKLFARPDIVKEHRLTHTNSYQTGKCRNCGVDFDKKVALLSHLKKCFKPEDVDLDITSASSPMEMVVQK